MLWDLLISSCVDIYKILEERTNKQQKDYLQRLEKGECLECDGKTKHPKFIST